MKKLIVITACFFACSFILQAQLVSTLAGTTAPGSVNGTGSAASFHSPYGICVDLLGQVYVADGGNKLIRKITPAGVVTTFAGSGSATLTNGTGTAASFSDPLGICADGSGNVYVADASDNVIRMITPAGVASTFAGSGALGSSDGPVASAKFSQPMGIACDHSGNIYVSEPGSNRIRKISGGMVSTLAGGGNSGSADGTGTLATFFHPIALCTDVSGNIFVADFGNNAIRKITPAGVVTTVAGSGTAGDADGTGTGASFNGPAGVSTDASGNIYVADNTSSRIRRIDPSGVVITLSGFAGSGFLDGSAQVAKFNGPRCIAGNAGDILYIVDAYNNSIRKISCVTTVPPSNTTYPGIAYALHSITLTASGTGTLNWYTTDTGGTAIATGTACITSSSLTLGSYIYYVDATTSCTTSARTAVPFMLRGGDGINTIQNNTLAVSVYPNPTTGVFTIESGSGLKTIEVSDHTGRVLLSSSTYDAKTQISLNAFASGVYYVKVQSGKAQNVMKVVKQ